MRANIFRTVYQNKRATTLTSAMASEDKEAASPTGLDPKLYDCDHLFAGVDFTKDTKQKTW